MAGDFEYGCWQEPTWDILFIRILIPRHNRYSYITNVYLGNLTSDSNIGLFSAIESIQKQISSREINDNLECLLFQRKKQLGVLDSNAISPLSEYSDEQLQGIISRKTNLIDGALIFYEFIKEYTLLSANQKLLIKMQNT